MSTSPESPAGRRGTRPALRLLTLFEVDTLTAAYRLGELVRPAQRGAIRFDVGYKLNPSVFDLRDPQDVLDAVLAGRDPATAPEHSMRRYEFHLSLGLYF